MQLSISDIPQDNKLSRPITKDDIAEFVGEYVSKNTTELGEKISKEAIINQLAVEEAVEIANDEKYSVNIIEKELRHTTNKLIGLGMIISFPIFAK